ncbi:MAG: response regulator [Actinobacteria bacterium]|nr:MAG: response regulator [Actinomycetota bacterium]
MSVTDGHGRVWAREIEDTVAIRVLIVDDTDHVRNMLSHMLTLDGFDVVGAAGGASEGIGALGQAAPDIVIMDLKMPIMDGIAATRMIRQDHPTLPIVLYTAYLDDAIAERAREAGVTACIGKVEGIASLEREISALCLELVEH